jgi:hypothetical protein
MKRDVCVDEPDSNMPTVRFRPVFWHELAISPCKAGEPSYLLNSTPTTQPPRIPPRAYAKTCHLSLGSPAIPPQFKASVLASKARQEHVGYLN